MAALDPSGVIGHLAGFQPGRTTGHHHADRRQYLITSSAHVNDGLDGRGLAPLLFPILESQQSITIELEAESRELPSP